MPVNGAVWRDTDGREIWCNGGQMYREDGRFHWIGYDTGPDRPWRIVWYESADLVAWRFRGDLIRQEGAFAGIEWAGRPGLVRSAATGRYVIIFEADAAGHAWFRHKVGYASADRIGGPYRLDGLAYPEPDQSTGDQSVYQEGGDAYLLAVLDTPGLRRPINVDLAIYKLAPDFLGVDRKVFQGFDATRPGARGNEASHLLKVGGTYYWFMSGLVGWNSSETRYATAPDLAGPWSPLRPLRTDPPSPDSFNTQHDFVLPVGPAGGPPYLYVGDRYSQWHGHGTGRNIFLPLAFEGGEPVLRWRDAWP